MQYTILLSHLFIHEGTSHFDLKLLKNPYKKQQ
jgi:hypothetical protein